MLDDIVLFGETNFRNQRVKFGIKTDDRRRHMYVIGKTGMGKTTLLENMVAQDIQAGRGVAVVDPHGEFADKMLDYVPSHRVNDVIYFNAGDIDYPIAFNVMEQVGPEYRHIMADGLVEVFRKLWAESWGPRLEYVLRNAILALLEYPGSTLLGIMRILVDKEYRKRVVEVITDPVVKSFWVDEFARYPQQFAVEAVAPIQNKVGQFLTSSLIRNIVGQTKTAVDLRDVMDSGKILILNLSKGLVGEGTGRLLGAMMITKLQLAAMSRVNVPEEQRRDFYLYVDEFQNFATISFVNILSEARKYRLNLVLAHQYIMQLEEEVSASVFGNVGTLITFRIGAEDAELFEKEFDPDFFITDFVNLAKYNIYLKLMIDGVASKGFSATTLPPPPKSEASNRDTIIRVSRERYGSSKQEVEAEIMKWRDAFLATEEGEGKGLHGEKAREVSEDRPLFDASCSACGKKTQIPFQPDGVRPVYCKDCLTEIRAGKRNPIPPKGAEARDSPQKGETPAVLTGSSGERKERRNASFRGTPVVRGTGPAISFQEALSQFPPPSPDEEVGNSSRRDTSSTTREKEPRRPRKPADLDGLREVLHDALMKNQERRDTDTDRASS